MESTFIGEGGGVVVKGCHSSYNTPRWKREGCFVYWGEVSSSGSMLCCGSPPHSIFSVGRAQKWRKEVEARPGRWAWAW